MLLSVKLKVNGYFKALKHSGLYHLPHHHVPHIGFYRSERASCVTVSAKRTCGFNTAANKIVSGVDKASITADITGFG
jgi:ribosomal protein L32